MSRTTVVVPEDLRDQAKALDINISDVCRYALETAIPAARKAREAGDEFEAFTFIMISHETEEEELVQFIGKEIADHYPLRWFLTPKGRIVEMFGEDAFREDDDISIFDDVEAFRHDLTSHADDDGERHRVLQAVEGMLGKTPTPRILDI